MHPRVAQLVEWQASHGSVQKSKAWLDSRRRRLTASDAAAVMGKNPYRNGLQVLMTKLGLGKAFEGNEATRHGEAYEDEAILLYEKITGRKVRHFGLVPHPHHPDLAASPDGITECGIALEVKVSF